MNVLLVAALVPAVAYDLRSRRIPHFITAPTAAAGLILAFAWWGLGDSGWKPGLLSSALGALAVYLPFAILVLTGGMGAGDANLMGAIGALLGLPGALGALVFVAITGGAQGVLAALARTPAGRRLCRRLGMTGTEEPAFAKMVPYGLSIAAGTVIFRIWQYAMVSASPIPPGSG